MTQLKSRAENRGRWPNEALHRVGNVRFMGNKLCSTVVNMMFMAMLFLAGSQFSCSSRSSHKAMVAVDQSADVVSGDQVGRPQWAVSFGDDDYGTWAEFAVVADGKKVLQLMRWISPGEYLMGSCAKELAGSIPDQSRVYLREKNRVRVDNGFWIAETACTQELWTAVMGDNPSWHVNNSQSFWFPVECVSYEMIQDFLSRLSELVPGLVPVLPTEKQWEYAARAGKDGPFSIYPVNTETINCRPFIGDMFVSEGRFRGAPVMVRSLPPNPWGLYEVHGNIGEMCSDKFDEEYNRIADDDPGHAEGSNYRRVVRGGSWAVEGWYCRSGSRLFSSSRGIGDDVGFRISAER